MSYKKRATLFWTKLPCFHGRIYRTS